jgi:hypothetical protein
MIGAIFALALQATAGADTPPRNAADGIGEILAHTPPDAPVPAPPPAAVPAPAPASAPAPPPVMAPPIAAAPSSPPDGRASLYESSIRSTFEAREARQGPLDGRWTLSDADGKGLYIFQLADPGAGRGPVEGAWRDLGRQGSANASGFLASADRTGEALVLRFEEGQAWVVTLTLGPDGRWSGRMQAADQSRPVVMTRS